MEEESQYQDWKSSGMFLRPLTSFVIWLVGGELSPEFPIDQMPDGFLMDSEKITIPVPVGQVIPLAFISVLTAIDKADHELTGVYFDSEYTEVAYDGETDNLTGTLMPNGGIEVYMRWEEIDNN